MRKAFQLVLLQLILLPVNILCSQSNPAENISYLPGFRVGISGVDFNYRSPLPQNEDAFILRNSFRNNEMIWKTDAVTLTGKPDTVAFVFMAAMSTDNSPLHYRLEVSNGEVFEFVNNQDLSWMVTGSEGGILAFFQSKNLPGIEINGFMILKVPGNRLRSDESLELKVSMLPTSRNGWIIVFKKALSQETSITNSPVLLRNSGALKQQVTITQIQFRKPGPVEFSAGGKVLLTGETKIGFNKFFVPVPEVHSDQKTTIILKYRNGTIERLTTTVSPVKNWEIYLVQHSHTDIGYTRPQSEILAEHLRYIDYALDYCDQTDQMPDDAKFRWTCESTWVVREYLRTRPASQIERFKKRIAEGRVEVTGMYFNMAEIADDNIMFDFFQPLQEISKHGIPVKTAMQNDVNGVAWCLPDYLNNTGVKYLTMGINEARSIRPFNVPTCFWWEAPSGNRLLAFRSDHYMTGNNFGLPDKKSFDPDKIFDYLKGLENGNYPFNRVAAQFSGYMTDNAPPSTGACEIVREWNEKYASPKLRLATASEFLDYVAQNHTDALPVHRQAWLDWWTDGFGSTSRETAITRKIQNIKQIDEGLFAMVSLLGGDLSPELEGKIGHISENALFFDEHTVGADESIDHPFSANSTMQWLQKGAYAWEALKKVTLLNEEALGQLQPYLGKAAFPLIYVINSFGWNRSGLVELFVDYQIIPANRPFRIIDLNTNQPVPVQLIRNRSEGAYWVLQVEDIPAMGWKAFKVDVESHATKMQDGRISDERTIENQFYRIILDPGSGAISSLIDKELGRELIDPGSSWKIGQLVRETLTDRNNMKETEHSTVTNIRMEQGSGGDLWQSIRFMADMEGFQKGTPDAPKGLEWEIRLYKHIKLIEFRFLGRKNILTSPEALYVTFPFNLPNSRIVFETIGGILNQGQQLPGSSSDWNAAQNFVSVRSPEGQIVLVSDEIPLWQFGGFNLGKFERYPVPGKPWLWSWVMNNYWTTNFRAYQEGDFHWTYQLTTLKDTSNAAAVHFSRGIRNSFATRTFPAAGSSSVQPTTRTLQVDVTDNVIILNSRPSFESPGSIMLNIKELNGKPGSVGIKSAVMGRPIRRMIQVNSIGDEIGNPIERILLSPFGQKFVRIDF